MQLHYEILPDPKDDAIYLVEAINYESEGEVYSALFIGPKAQERAAEYAGFKNNPG